jgi:hypothetical protein
MVSVLAIAPKVRMYLLRRLSKAGGPMLQDVTACKKSFASMNKNIWKGQIHHSILLFLLLATR